MNGDPGAGGDRRGKGAGGGTVRGRMSPDALLRAPELFDQSMATIVSELLQSARRAGATTVSVTIGQDPDGEPFARFEDDGGGIDDVQALVAFGRTAWGDEVRRSEDTAGMGAYCLASRGCRVTSRGKSVVLSPNVFVGLEAAPVQQAAHRPGTVIEFSLRRDASGLVVDEVELLSQAIASECLYSPIPVSFEGRLIPRLPFLEHALEVRVIEGVAIGVYSQKAWALRTEQGPLTGKHRSAGDEGLRHAAGPHGFEGLVSFGGHVAKTPERVRVRDGDTEVTALWEVRDNPRLRLLLPTRDRVIEDDAWHSLVKATRLALCDHVLRQPVHRLAMKDVRFARKNGIAATDPALVLTRWKPIAEKALLPKPNWRSNADAFDKRGRASGDQALRCIIVPGSWPPHARHVLFAAVRRMNPAPDFAAEDRALDGLAAYDELPRLTGLDLKVAHHDGSQHRINDFHLDDGAAKAKGRVPPSDRIADLCWDDGGSSLAARLIGVTIRSGRLDAAAPDEPTVHGPVRLPVVVNGDGRGRAGAIAFLASKALTAADLDDCAREIAAVTFSERYNHGQVYNTPASWLRDVREQLLRRTSDGASVKLQELVSAIADQLAHLGLEEPNNPVGSIEITTDPDGDWPDCPFTITVTGVDGTVVTTADGTDDREAWDW